MTKICISFAIPVTMCLVLTLPKVLEAQDKPQDEVASLQVESNANPDDRFKRFSDALSGSKFVGNFTILGQDNQDLTAEEYHIKSVQKMEKGDMWLFTARIKYGERDVSVPIPLEVKWAGDTPVISVTDFSFFGIGPFSARVVIYNGKYAGTWSHGKVGGHLFGTIEEDAAEGVDVEKTKRDMEKKKEKAAEGSGKESTRGNQ